MKQILSKADYEAALQRLDFLVKDGEDKVGQKLMETDEAKRAELKAIIRAYAEEEQILRVFVNEYIENKEC